MGGISCFCLDAVEEAEAVSGGAVWGEVRCPWPPTQLQTGGGFLLHVVSGTIFPSAPPPHRLGEKARGALVSPTFGARPPGRSPPMCQEGAGLCDGVRTEQSPLRTVCSWEGLDSVMGPALSRAPSAQCVAGRDWTL